MGQFENGDRVTLVVNGNYRRVKDRLEPYVGTIKEASTGQVTIDVLPGMSDVMGGPMVVTGRGWEENDIMRPVRDDVRRAYEARPERIAETVARGWVGRPASRLRALDEVLGPIDDRTKSPPVVVLGGADAGTVITASSMAPEQPAMVSLRVRRHSDDVIVRVAINGSAHVRVRIEGKDDIQPGDQTGPAGILRNRPAISAEIALAAANGDLVEGSLVVQDADGKVRAAR